MPVIKVKIDLNYVHPNTSFIYPLQSEDDTRILDARVVLSKTLLSDIIRKHGHNVFYLKNVTEKTMPPHLINEAAVQTRSILEEITHTEKISRASFNKAERVVENILRSLDFAEIKAINLLKDVKTFDDYLYQHLVNVGILAALFARKIGTIPDDDVRHLTLGAYLIDIGIMRVDRQLIKKQGQYDITDIMKMKRHPQLGYEMLKNNVEINPIVLQTILFHHERYNGKGYYGLPYENLPFPPKLVAICDTYDALTSKRPHREPFTPSRTMKILVNSIEVNFDYKLVHDFIYHLGPMLGLDESIIAQNQFCELSTSEFALVKEQGERNHLKPKVIVFCKFSRIGKRTEVSFLKHPIEIDLIYDTDRYITKILTNEKQISIIKDRLSEKKLLTDFIR